MKFNLSNVSTGRELPVSGITPENAGLFHNHILLKELELREKMGKFPIPVDLVAYLERRGAELEQEGRLPLGSTDVTKRISLALGAFDDYAEIADGVKLLESIRAYAEAEFKENAEIRIVASVAYYSAKFWQEAMTGDSSGNGEPQKLKIPKWVRIVGKDILGALEGAGLGSAFGPVGTIAGGVAGAVVGSMPE